MSPLVRLALPVLAAAGTAFALTCSNSATATVQNGGDASAIASCTTFSGSIAIATGVSDDISFDGNLEEIDGSLIVDSNSNIQRFSAGSLTTVSHELKFNDVSQLAGLSLPKLDEVDTLTLTGLANLRQLEFSGQLTKCNNLHIENTQLQSLDGIALESAKTFNIANNPAITNISMPLTNLTSNFTVSVNSEDTAISFPKLLGAANMVFRGVASISVPALSEIKSGDFYVLSSKLSSVAAPNLTSIDGALVLDQNGNLNNVSFPLLTDIQRNLFIANNSNLHSVDGFPVLKNVYAALDISGNLTKVATPDLDLVKGVFNLQSTGDIGTICSDFYDPLKNKGKISKGSYVCQGKLKEAGTAGSSPTPTGSSKPSGAASPLNVQNAYLGLAGMAAFFLA